MVDKPKKLSKHGQEMAELKAMQAKYKPFKNGQIRWGHLKKYPEVWDDPQAHALWEIAMWRGVRTGKNIDPTMAREFWERANLARHKMVSQELEPEIDDQEDE